NPFGVRPDVSTNRHAHTDGAGHRADGPVEHGGAEEMEEAAIQGRALDQPQRARVRVRENRLWPVSRACDLAQPFSDLGECLVPGDPGKALASSGADAAH